MARNRWLVIGSVLLSLAMALAVGAQLAELEWRALVALLPASPLFWLAFTLFYLATVIGDWVIFRRLWGPHRTTGDGGVGWAGFIALMKKQVYNDLILSYLGEAAFLAWARGRASGPIGEQGARVTPDRAGEPTAAPVFGAIKDVAILSALAGNLITVALLAWAWPQVSAVLLGQGSEAIFWSIAAVMGLSLVLLALRGRVFTLPRPQLVFAFAIHTVRILVRATLGALVWHLLLPQVPLAWWLWLAALRQVVSRLPMVANKDLIFAGLAVLVLDDGAPVADIIAFTAALIVATNVAVGAVLVAGDTSGLVRLLRSRRAFPGSS